MQPCSALCLSVSLINVAVLGVLPQSLSLSGLGCWCKGSFYSRWLAKWVWPLTTGPTWYRENLTGLMLFCLLERIVQWILMGSRTKQSLWLEDLSLPDNMKQKDVSVFCHVIVFELLALLRRWNDLTHLGCYFKMSWFDLKVPRTCSSWRTFFIYGVNI